MLGRSGDVWALQPRFLMYPLNSRRIYEKMLSLPQDYRREERLPEDLIRLKWPELLEFPFNEPVGLLKLEFQARRTLTERADQGRKCRSSENQIDSAPHSWITMTGQPVQSQIGSKCLMEDHQWVVVGKEDSMVVSSGRTVCSKS